MDKNNLFILMGTIFILFTGCTLAKVEVEVLSERTALENQILGTYNAIGKEMLLMASVRGVDAKGNIRKPQKQSQEQKDAVMALQIQAFHADDIALFKELGWVGENNMGTLTLFDMEKKKVPDHLKSFANRYQQDEFESVVKEVNQSRETIMQRVIQMNENLTKDDLPEIRRLFGKINGENSLAKEKIQTENGTWIEKDNDE